VAIKLIAERKVNTLIMVDKVNLLSQWKERLLEFLIVNESLPQSPITAVKKRGRKKKAGVIGQLGSGKNTLSGIVDILGTLPAHRRDSSGKKYHFGGYWSFYRRRV
jgi:superfamily II DNA or RNA helicase